MVKIKHAYFNMDTGILQGKNNETIRCPKSFFNIPCENSHNELEYRCINLFFILIQKGLEVFKICLVYS